MQISHAVADFLRDAIRRHGWIDLPAQGSSMFPWIQQGNICRFASCDAALLRKGDIVLFHSSGENFIAHRLQHRYVGDGELRLLCKGDTNLSADEPIREQQLIGKLVHVRRNHKTFHMNGLAAWLWGKTILAFPLLSRWLQLYLALNKRKNTDRPISGVFQ